AFGVPAVVAVNVFPEDTVEELRFLQAKALEMDAMAAALSRPIATAERGRRNWLRWSWQPVSALPPAAYSMRRMSLLRRRLRPLPGSCMGQAAWRLNLRHRGTSKSRPG